MELALSVINGNLTLHEDIELASLHYVDKKGTDVASKMTILNLFTKQKNCTPTEKCPKFDYAVVDSVMNNLTTFNTIYITRKATLEQNMTSLGNIDILTIEGTPSPWLPHQQIFNYFDPCQMMMLRLQRTSVGNYTVKLPSGMQTNGDFFCVAIRDNVNAKNDLVLYQTRNNSKIWTASTIFRGILTTEYIKTVPLRITTKRALIYSVKEAEISVKIVPHNKHHHQATKLTTVAANPQYSQLRHPHFLPARFISHQNATEQL